MALIEWQEKYSVGIGELDNQHRELVSMMNKLNEAMLAGKGTDILGKILNDLSAYVSVHFSTEEKYFDKYRYPGKAIHVKAHNDFITEITEFKNMFHKSKTMLSIKIMTFLRKWLLEHISGEDRKYSEFLRSQGMS